MLYTPILYKLEDNEYNYQYYYQQLMSKYILYINKIIYIALNNSYINSTKCINSGEKLKKSLFYLFNKIIINNILIIEEYKYLIKISDNMIEKEMFESLIEEYKNKNKNIIFLKKKEFQHNFDINYIKKYIKNEYIIQKV
jgi:hypothetical protein